MLKCSEYIRQRLTLSFFGQTDGSWWVNRNNVADLECYPILNPQGLTWCFPQHFISSFHHMDICEVRDWGLAECLPQSNLKGLLSGWGQTSLAPLYQICSLMCLRILLCVTVPTTLREWNSPKCPVLCRQSRDVLLASVHLTAWQRNTIYHSAEHISAALDCNCNMICTIACNTLNSTWGIWCGCNCIASETHHTMRSRNSSWVNIKARASLEVRSCWFFRKLVTSVVYPSQRPMTPLLFLHLHYHILVELLSFPITFISF